MTDSDLHGLVEEPPKEAAEALAGFIDAWEAKHGELTAEELARATAEIGLAPEPRIGPAA